MTASAREIHHRAVKVDKILVAIRRLQQSSDEYARLVAAGDKMGVQRLITATAGVHEPSDTTWQWVTELVRRDGVYAA